MTDLERVFRRLVDNLVAIDPVRLHQPVVLEDLLANIIPYRANRRALQVDSAEDYDLLLLRLCAGEGGFVQTDPPEAQAMFRQEVASTNPDLTLLQTWKDARLILATEPLAYALGPDDEEEFAPPEETVSRPEPPPPAPPIPPAPVPPEASPSGLRIEPVAAHAEPASSEPVEMEDGGGRCGYCGGLLPAGRTVNFCPHCGESQTIIRCPECQAELELGWRHCVNCGHPLGE